MHLLYNNIDFNLLMIEGFMVKMLFHSLEVRSHPLPLTPPPMIEGATTPDHDFMRCVVQLGHKTSSCNAVSLTLPNALDLKPIKIF